MEAYAGQQFVGIDLHRRRSVIVRTTERGDPLETVRITNDVDSLTKVMARAGVSPEVVLEATYGWYWAADALADVGASVHLAHPLGVKAFAYRRVKNDVRDATDLADLLRMGRLPEAWIAPPATRELRELVRYRAKLVGIRSGCKCEIHAVLAKCGVQVLMSDLFARLSSIMVRSSRPRTAAQSMRGVDIPSFLTPRQPRRLPQPTVRRSRQVSRLKHGVADALHSLMRLHSAQGPTRPAARAA